MSRQRVNNHPLFILCHTTGLTSLAYNQKPYPDYGIPFNFQLTSLSRPSTNECPSIPLESSCHSIEVFCIPPSTGLFPVFTLEYLFAVFVTITTFFLLDFLHSLSYYDSVLYSFLLCSFNYLFSFWAPLFGSCVKSLL